MKNITFCLTTKPAASLTIQDSPEERLQPIITKSPQTFDPQLSDGVNGSHRGRGTRTIPCRIARLLVAAAFGLAALATRPARADFNGSFTNNGSGWVGLGPAPSAGAPRLVTNPAGATVLEIGSNSVAGVPGTPNARVTSAGRNRCPLGSWATYCAVRFHANWTPVGTETAKVTVVYTSNGKSDRAQFTVPITGGDQFVKGADQCGSEVQVSFTIDSGGKPVQSTLQISDVRAACELTSWACLTPQPNFDEPRSPGYPLAYASGAEGTLAVSIPAGLSPLANPFSAGSNYLDEVLPAADDTILYKYSPETESFETYYRSFGEWFPWDGTLAPGEAAFIDSLEPQEIVFSGQYVPLPFGPHPASGSAYFANPVPWPVLVEDVMGFKPVMGDVILLYRHGDTNGTGAPNLESTFIFRPDNFAEQPEIPAGETIRVFFADPSKVPLTIRRADTNVLVSAPGDLPSDGVLQTAPAIGAAWKSLLGVADFYSEPASAGLHLFRMDYNLPTGQLFGRITGAGLTGTSGALNPELTVQLGPNGPSQTLPQGGNFTFGNVPRGLVDLLITAPVRVGGATGTVTTTGAQETEYNVSLPLTVDLSQATASVNLKQDFVVQVAQLQPPCDCVPWCGIVGGTVNGVQKVVAGGGKLPPNCNGQATVTIHGPNGVNVNLGQGGRRTFSPAANGVWTVTSTVCGITKTCTISLP